KDGINDHVVHGAATVNPEKRGTKGALHYVLTVPAGGQAQIRLRLALTGAPPGTDPAPSLNLGADCEATMAARRAEADEFFAALVPAGASADEAAVVRAAIAGLMWGKQFYHFDVERWLTGDPSAAPPPD